MKDVIPAHRASPSTPLRAPPGGRAPRAHPGGERESRVSRPGPRVMHTSDSWAPAFAGGDRLGECHFFAETEIQVPETGPRWVHTLDSPGPMSVERRRVHQRPPRQDAEAAWDSRGCAAAEKAEYKMAPQGKVRESAGGRRPLRSGDRPLGRRTKVLARRPILLRFPPGGRLARRGEAVL